MWPARRQWSEQAFSQCLGVSCAKAALASNLAPSFAADCWTFFQGVILSEAKDLLFVRTENKADIWVASQPQQANNGLVGDSCAKSARPQDTITSFSAAC